ncbi:Uncharacterised protein [Bordetella avium]|nr:Uncharacterised protein [Bordetella avium]
MAFGTGPALSMLRAFAVLSFPLTPIDAVFAGVIGMQPRRSRHIVVRCPFHVGRAGSGRP